MTIICPGELKEPENRLDKLNSIEPHTQKCHSIRCANHIFKKAEVVFIYFKSVLCTKNTPMKQSLLYTKLRINSPPTLNLHRCLSACVLVKVIVY